MGCAPPNVELRLCLPLQLPRVREGGTSTQHTRPSPGSPEEEGHACPGLQGAVTTPNANIGVWVGEGPGRRVCPIPGAGDLPVPAAGARAEPFLSRAL